MCKKLFLKSLLLICLISIVVGIFFYSILTRARVLNDKKAWLVLGIDNHARKDIFQTDIINILQYDPQKGLKLIGIPRGLLVYYPSCLTPSPSIVTLNLFSNFESGNKSWKDSKEYFEQKDALKLFKACLSEILGIKIDHHILIEPNALISIVDTVGGVTVDVEKAFLEKDHPVYEREKIICDPTNIKVSFCRLKEIEFKTGKQKLDGVTALAFVRSRKNQGDPGATAREGRALQVFKSLIRDTSLFQKIKAFTLAKNNIVSDVGIFSMAQIWYPILSKKDLSASYINLSKILADKREEETLGGIGVTPEIINEIRQALQEAK